MERAEVSASVQRTIKLGAALKSGVDNSSILKNSRRRSQVIVSSALIHGYTGGDANDDDGDGGTDSDVWESEPSVSAEDSASDFRTDNPRTVPRIDEQIAQRLDDLACRWDQAFTRWRYHADDAASCLAAFAPLCLIGPDVVLGSKDPDTLRTYRLFYPHHTLGLLAAATSQLPQWHSWVREQPDSRGAQALAAAVNTVDFSREYRRRGLDPLRSGTLTPVLGLVFGDLVTLDYWGVHTLEWLQTLPLASDPVIMARECGTILGLVTLALPLFLTLNRAHTAEQLCDALDLEPTDKPTDGGEGFERWWAAFANEFNYVLFPKISILTALRLAIFLAYPEGHPACFLATLMWPLYSPAGVGRSYPQEGHAQVDPYASIARVSRSVLVHDARESP
jgi:hypothetical protein